MAYIPPTITVDGLNINNGITHVLQWNRCEGLLDPAGRMPGKTIRTFAGPAKIRAQDMDYEPRRITIVGRLINRSGFMNKHVAISTLQEYFDGRPSKLQIGSLYLEVEFGPVEIVDDGYKRIGGALTYRVQGEAVPGTFYGSYCYSVGNAQGVVVNDDRVDHSSLKLTSSSGLITASNPGDVPCEAVVVLSNSSYASTAVYVKNNHTLSDGRRVPVNLDASGSGEIDEASCLMLYPGSNQLEFENEAGTTLTSGTFAVNLYGTRFRYAGNATSSYARGTEAGLGNMFSETAPLTIHRTGQASYYSTAGTLTTATDGQARIGLPYVVRRNLFANSGDFASASWTKNALTATYVDSDGQLIATTNNFANLYQLFTVTAGQVLTMSWYAKRGTMTDMKYRIDNVTAGTTIVAATSYYSQTNASTYSRITVTFTVPVGCTQVQVQPLRDSLSQGTCYIGRAQLEIAASATPYQATNSSGVDLTNSINGAGLVLEGAATNLLTSNQATGGDTLNATTGFASSGTTVSPGSTLSVETTASNVYQGSKSIKVVTTSASAGQGVETSNTAAAANTAHTMQIRIKTTAGQQLSVRFRDNTNGVSNTQTIVGTGSFETVTASITTGAVAVTSLTISVYTASAAVVTFYVDALQIEANPFPTSWVDGTRNADICGIVPPHNLLKYSEDLTQSTAWIVSGMAQPTKSGANNTANFDSVNDYIYQSLAPSSFAGKTYTFAVRLKAGTLSGTFSLGFGNHVGALIIQTTFNTSQLSATEARTFYVTATIPTSATAFWCYIQNNSGTGTILIESARCIEGSHPGIYVRTTDTAIPAPTSPVLDPAWQQNGSLKVRILPPTTSAVSFTALGATDYVLNLNNQGANIVYERKQTASTGSYGTGYPGRSFIQASSATLRDSAPHDVELVWKNYTIDGTRYMPMELWIDDTLVASQDVASLYGATEWAEIDPSKLVSDGNTFATLSNLTLGYPTLPAGAIPPELE